MLPNTDSDEEEEEITTNSYTQVRNFIFSIVADVHVHIVVHVGGYSNNCELL